MPLIHWMNNASYLLVHGGIGLLCDPWYMGSAFNDGWELLSPSPPLPHDLPLTHVWFSHEHPDHFSPATLDVIPIERRRRLTALYQPTRDGRVVAHLRRSGFGDVQELPPGRWKSLGDGMEALCQPWRSGDSYLLVEAAGTTVVNLNDCVVDTPRKVAFIRGQLRAPVSVLLTQFSFANWVGNPDQGVLRRCHAAEKLVRIRYQSAALAPAAMVPFASFMWFGHEENRHLNDGMNTAADACRAVAGSTTRPVVLYPGDRWAIGTLHDNRHALRRYADDLAQAAERSPLTSAGLEIADLVGLAAGYLGDLSRINGPAVLGWAAAAGVLPPTRLWLTDLHQGAVLSVTGLRLDGGRPERCDVALSSQSLAFMFKHLYGGGTLHSNGRFTLPAGGRPERFFRWVHIGNLNNRGLPLLEIGRELAARVRYVSPLAGRAADPSPRVTGQLKREDRRYRRASIRRGRIT